MIFLLFFLIDVSTKIGQVFTSITALKNNSSKMSFDFTMILFKLNVLIAWHIQIHDHEC